MCKRFDSTAFDNKGGITDTLRVSKNYRRRAYQDYGPYYERSPQSAVGILWTEDLDLCGLTNFTDTNDTIYARTAKIYLYVSLQITFSQIRDV